jgi:hypothetical protein
MHLTSKIWHPITECALEPHNAGVLLILQPRILIFLLPLGASIRCKRPADVQYFILKGASLFIKQESLATAKLSVASDHVRIIYDHTCADMLMIGMNCNDILILFFQQPMA